LRPNSEPDSPARVKEKAALLEKRRDERLRGIPFNHSIIVHEASPRDDYTLYGRLSFGKDLSGKLAIENLQFGSKVQEFSWRDSSTGQVHFSKGDANELRDANFPQEYSQNLIQAIKAIVSKTQKVSEDGKPVEECEASFAIKKGSTELEFYDFLVRKLSPKDWRL
jgi:hypothetical protein